MRDYAELVSELQHYFDDVPMVMDAADAIEELLKEVQRRENDCINLTGECATLYAQIPKWISVEERLPEVGNIVLLYFHHKYWGDVIHTGFLTADGDFWHDVLKDKGQPPTHWMPLPDPPKGASE